MRVLGLTKIPSAYSSRDGYIVEVSEDELPAVANKASYSEEFPKLGVGQDYPLSEGYDFRRDIVEATRLMQQAHEKFAHASQTMTRFAALIQSREEA